MLCIPKSCPDDHGHKNYRLCAFQISKDHKGMSRIIHTLYNHLLIFPSDLNADGSYKNPLMDDLIKCLEIDNRVLAIVYMNQIDPTQLIY